MHVYVHMSNVFVNIVWCVCVVYTCVCVLVSMLVYEYGCTL